MITFDARWIGDHGIGRFAREVRSRIQLPVHDLTGGSPVTPREMVRTEALMWGKRRRSSLFFSPGYCPPFTWRGPIILTVHDLIHLHIPEERTRVNEAYYRQVVRPVLRRSPVVLTVSQFSQAEIAEWAGLDDDRVVVVGDGVDASFSPDGPTFDPGFPYVLCVGNTKPHKNLPRLLEAFTQLDASLRLILTGRPDPHLLDQARHLGLGERVSFSGFLPAPDLVSYYRGARAVAVPSLYEGFGLAALEAMACGTPVVAANASALPEVVGSAGLLVDPYEVDAIRDGLERAVSEEDLRQRLRVDGPRQAAHFTWDAVSARVNEQLHAAVAPPETGHA